MLTNNLSPMDPTAPVAQRLLPLFDTVVQSAVEGVRKPDPRFYLLACERLEVEPTECVFLDDLGVNCKPARALGMHTIKVTDPLDAIVELEAVLDVTLR
jgi:putative hydrolase of the HAD superfamily